MPRVVAFIPDLLFGSQVLQALSGSGYEVALVADPEEAGEAQLVIVDLTWEAPERIRRVLAAGVPGARTLAFYSHVEGDVRQHAIDAGFATVVPRSRMAREAAALVARALGEAPRALGDAPASGDGGPLAPGEAAPSEDGSGPASSAP